MLTATAVACCATMKIVKSVVESIGVMSRLSFYAVNRVMIPNSIASGPAVIVVFAPICQSA